jgi:hypothetical protein
MSLDKSIDLNKQIYNHAKQMGYGSIQLTAKVHQGEVTGVDSVKITPHKLTTNDRYTEVTTIILTLLKAQQATASNKTLSFTVLFDKAGVPDVLQVQDFVRL